MKEEPPKHHVLLAVVESPAPKPQNEAILSEILALRKIVINLLYVLYGQAP